MAEVEKVKVCQIIFWAFVFRSLLKRVCFRKYDVYVPKFSIKTSYKLNDVLAEMGVTDVFGNGANLSGIAEDARLKVSEVKRRSIILQQ